MTTLDEGDNGRTVDLAQGQELEVVLPENPTTGHRWRLESDGAPACAAVGDVYEPPDPAVPGRGGVHRWRFQGKREGTGAVALVLGRTWEKSGPGVQTLRVEVRVPRG